MKKITEEKKEKENIKNVSKFKNSKTKSDMVLVLHEDD